MSESTSDGTCVASALPAPSTPTMAFVDASFLLRAACRVLDIPANARRLDVEAVVDWLHAGASGSCPAESVRRIGWYEGAYDAAHPGAAAQQRFHHAIGELDGVQLRLGRLREIQPPWQHDVRAALRLAGTDMARFEERCPLRPEMRQKGVDVTLALDLESLARRGALAHALLVLGDSDFVPAIERARDAGVLTTLLVANRYACAPDLRQVVDRTVEIPVSALGRLLRTRPRPVTDRPRAQSRQLTVVDAPQGAIRPTLAPAPVTPARQGPAAPGATPGPCDRDAAAVRDLRVGSYRDGDHVGLTLSDADGSARVYLVPSEQEPGSVQVFAGEHGNPARDRLLGTHRVLPWLRTVA